MDKICRNAPSTNISHDLCVAFLQTCTVNSANAGCVEKTCENTLVQALCDKDLNNKACIWKGKCYKKECLLASSTTATHADCQKYDSSCTLSNTGYGCVPLPNRCEAITIQTACNIRLQVINGVKSYQACGWNGSQCIDRTCATAPRISSTTNECNNYKSGCVANNPVNGTIQGCQDLPTTCAARKSIQNCEISRTDFPTCLWNTATLTCEEKSCSTASITTTKGFLTNFSSSNCTGYLNTCIANNTANGCIPKPSRCYTLVSTNCGIGSKANGDCYWSGFFCYDRECLNILSATHKDCQAVLHTCTVNDLKIVCQPLATVCTSYGSAENCVINSNQKKCIWTGTACRNAICTDAPDEVQYSSDTGCQAYPSPSETCTVMLKAGRQGCMTRLPDCSHYKSIEQCFRTLTAISDDCEWKSAYNKCFPKSYLQGACSTFTGTKLQCEQIKSGCTNSQNAVETTICTFSCTAIIRPNLSHTVCQQYSITCTANTQNTACLTLKTGCGSYTTSGNCVRQINGLRCFWDSTANSNAGGCVYFSAAYCSTLTGLKNASHADCQAYHYSCTVNVAKTACMEQKSSCSRYTEDTCTFTTYGVKCIWKSGSCGLFTGSDCPSITGLINATHSECYEYNSSCTVNVARNACLQRKENCSDYSEAECTMVISFTTCFWNGSACGNFTAANCASVTGLTSATHQVCQAYHPSCTVNIARNACIEQQVNCSDYVQSTCTTTTGNQTCYWNGFACVIFSTCEAITGSNLIWSTCQGYNNKCSVKRDGSGCITQQSQCSEYTSMNSCFISTNGYCTANSDDTSCQPITDSTACEAIKLGSSFSFDNTKCQEFKAGCLAQSTTGCRAIACADYIGTKTHPNCNGWLPTCTVNAAGDACINLPATCASLTQSNCFLAVEGQCVVQGTACDRKTCEAAPSSLTNNNDCAAYLSTCTAGREGGCQARAACSTYKSSQQCKFNSSSQKCFWNTTNSTCVDLSCDNIEATSLYNTHEKCVAVDATLLCTVRASNGATISGCMARGACSFYQIEDQCRINASGGVCVWNKNLASAACQDKSCTTAPIALATHTDCDAYFSTSTIKCTVVAIQDANGVVQVLGGCQQTAACSTYIHQEQCKFNANEDVCEWNGTLCADKSCATASATADYDDDDKCRNYFNNNCTVAESGQGCVDIPDTCETMVEKQCVSDKSGRLCYWNGTYCITRSCENAPEAISTAEECNSYLAGCTFDAVKCKTKICEDFAFATDELCKQALSTCTTNGTNCVTRGSCFDALNQAGCVTSVTNQLCEWMPAMESNQAYCTVRTCNTAPITLTSEAACADYFVNCTTQIGGGCITKSTCSAVTIDAACTTALDGTICAWDSALTECRNKDCQDFSGTTHAACQGQRAGCTAGVNGKCARFQNCEQTTNRSACIEGTNGPCLWINDFVNSDGTRGACFRYTSCESLPWNSDAQCKWISNQCTTNGQHCIGITLCSETNTDGGCVTGYDGACIQSVPGLNSQDPKVCKPYKSCADAFYTTHADCQIASSKCTTNGATGCIALGACSSYTSQAECFYNDKGTVYTSGAITSTGNCTWDTIAGSCRDQSCTDLTGTTHETCSSQLSKCTSDGTNCLLKRKCSLYTTQTACTTAVGSDGTCFWEFSSARNNNIAKCRLLTCADIQNGTAINVCFVALSSCISNGIACIYKANCSTYTTKTACNSGGLDGICVFTQLTAAGAVTGAGTCTLMTACTTANNDQVACQAAKDRCSWTPASGTGATSVASKCATHTCVTNQATTGACTRFLNWDKKTQQICIQANGTCTAADPSTLSSYDCLLVSGYTYTWNASTSKCGVCTAVVDNNQNIENNQTTTNSGYILGLSTVILGYLMF